MNSSFRAIAFSLAKSMIARTAPPLMRWDCSRRRRSDANRIHESPINAVKAARFHFGR